MLRFTSSINAKTCSDLFTLDEEEDLLESQSEASPKKAKNGKNWLFESMINNS